MNPHRILIVKLAAIGDVVMALPLLSALRKKYPHAHITWLCGSQVTPLLKSIPSIDHIIEIDEKRLLAGNFLTKLRALFQIWRTLAGQVFDLVLTLHSDSRYRLITWPIFCSDRKNWGKNGNRVFPIPGRYHAQEALQLIESQEGPSIRTLDFPPLIYSPSAKIQQLTEPLKNKPLILLAPGGAKNILADDALRRWPIESYIEVAKELSEQAHVILTGSRSDTWVSPHFRLLPIHDLIDQLSLLDLLALLQCSALLITHDSGPLHLAKLTKTPTIALFGPTNPHEKISREENISILWGGEHLACRPCYNGKTYSTCHQNACLRSISPNRVLEEAYKKLAMANISL